MIRHAIIGCGGISRAHLRGLKTLKDEGLDKIELTALCDVDESRVRAFAEEAREQLGARPQCFTDYREMLDKAELDSVGVNTHHKSHYPISRDCLDAGVHVFVEKPVSITPSSARRLIAFAKEKGKTLGVAENYRRAPERRAIKRILDEGVIGSPYLIIKQFASVGSAVFCRTPWRHLKEEGGPGPIFDNGVHDADLFLYWLGEVDEAASYHARFEPHRRTDDLEVRPTNEDTDVTVLKFKSGALGDWVCSWAGHGAGMGQQVILCSKGSLNGAALTLDGQETIPGDEVVRRYAGDVRSDSFATELEDWADALMEGREPETNGEAGYKAMCLSYAALESAVIGRPVKVAQIESGELHAYEDTVHEAMGGEW